MGQTTFADRDARSPKVVSVAIRLERLIGCDLSSASSRVAFCPRFRHEVDVKHCARCPFHRAATLGPDDTVLECEAGDAACPDSAEPPSSTCVGALLHGAATLIDGELRFAPVRCVVDVDEPLLLVVEGASGRYLGCLDRQLIETAQDLPPRVRALLLDSARVCDVMTRVTPVAEDASVLEAATVMTRARMRYLPVVTREGRATGVVRDLDLLRAGR